MSLYVKDARFFGSSFVHASKKNINHVMGIVRSSNFPVPVAPLALLESSGVVPSRVLPSPLPLSALFASLSYFLL